MNKYKCHDCGNTDDKNFYPYRPSKCKPCMKKIVSRKRVPDISETECKKCNLTKPRSEFSVSANTGLLYNKCNTCKYGKYDKYKPITPEKPKPKTIEDMYDDYVNLHYSNASREQIFLLVQSLRKNFNL